MESSAAIRLYWLERDLFLKIDDEVERIVAGAPSRERMADVKWMSGSTFIEDIRPDERRPRDYFSLNSINALVRHPFRRFAVTAWKTNSDVSDERFWQQLFQENPFILEHVFPSALVAMQSPANLGGKTITNRGGRLVDVYAQSMRGGRAVLIELKTPTTRLLGKEYRTGVFVTCPSSRYTDSERSSGVGSFRTSAALSCAAPPSVMRAKCAGVSPANALCGRTVL